MGAIALPIGSAPYDFNTLRNDLGISGPISLNNSTVRCWLMAETGAVSVSNIYRKLVNITSGTNVDIRTAAVNAGWNGTDRVQIDHNDFNTMGSATTGSYAATLTGSFTNGVLFVNRGKIYGMGGAGGNGNNNGNGGNGSQSGSALYVHTITSPNNKAYIINGGTGVIASGGGGGGGGGAIYYISAYDGKNTTYSYRTGGGGGGGAGYTTSSGGNNNGGTGGTTGGGAGYNTGTTSGVTFAQTLDTVWSGNGGDGGFFGSAGASATAGSVGTAETGEIVYAAGSGGSAGASITGYSTSVVFYNGGTVYGGYN